MKKKFKTALAWMQVFLFPVAIIGYIVVACGIGLKITGYVLKFDFGRVLDEIQGMNEDFNL